MTAHRNRLIYLYSYTGVSDVVAITCRCWFDKIRLPVTGGFPSQKPMTWSFYLFFLICAWNGWTNTRGAGDLRRHRALMWIWWPRAWPTYQCRIHNPGIWIFNSMRPSDAYVRRKTDHHRFRQWLVAWTAPSHYLNQCWNIVNWTLGNKFRWNLYRNL